MQTNAVLLRQPEQIVLETLPLDASGPADLVVAVDWSGISTGTERLLFSGRMPSFPGMGYPLVPGYEAVGRVVEAGAGSGFSVGTPVFVPGAQCFGPVRGLFGASASRLVVPAARALKLGPANGDVPDRSFVLLALAATAQHALAAAPVLPELIVGHGVLGRLLARLVVAAGGTPVVWERDAARLGGAVGYSVLDPESDPRRDYRAIVDVSGDPALLDTLVGRAARGGSIVLAGFYPDRVGFAFAPAFMREITLRVAAEWQRPDLETVQRMVADGVLSLAGLISHAQPAENADCAYRTAFFDATCIKMVLDWSADA
ncbi:chlorophyll synthesis pathway protein BchC [Acetobacteraceae bacterium KSS8]|uniref:Chlorophyll synthesis pathway protein BchC n=2 Tax=Endosaccharibacter trunci TaxID=2812733 RepID=A0ABT1W3R0_9PROT|nr:chlorophyll synthesis pathway protein BchC [Acetobacteraceae bacterium KSS8]